MPKILRWNEIRKPGQETDPDHGFWKFRIMAEGDSWFTLGGLPEQWNLLQSMTLPNRTIIVSLAKPGDTIRSMADIWKNKALHQSMDAGPPKFGYDWDIILLSGGGNDLIDYAKDLIKPIAEVTGGNPADFVRADRLDAVLQYIQQAYRNIVGLRDGPRSTCAGKPLVTHTYDHATPRNAPTKFFEAQVRGPWLFPAFVAAGVPENLFNALSDYLIGALAKAILDLQHGANPLPNFHVVDTRGTLERAALGTTGNDHDWLNEIHPNRGGYGKLAGPFSEIVRQQLGL
ncbi:MAG: SGNH/GDSL hydrolase family protein [Burkholderiales bacterium]